MLRCFALCLIIRFSFGLEVKPITNCTIETYQTILDFHGIKYQKRELNTSVEVSMSFEVMPVNDLGQLSLEWLHDSSNLDVARSRVDKEADRSDVYSTVDLNPATATATVTLHMKNKGLASGNYTLIASTAGISAVGSSFATAAPILPVFSKTKRVLEGDVLRLMCNPGGYPKPDVVHWGFSSINVDQMEESNTIAAAGNHLGPLNLNVSHYELQTSEGSVPNDTLRFSRLLMEDNGLYACNVSNMYGSDVTYILVNVKDRWAALWPFIGIVIEVAVLVTAILLYERHQMRSKPTKLDVNPNPQDASSPSTKQRAAATVQQQHNSTTPATDVTNDTEVNKTEAVEALDPKTEDLRQRGAAKC